MCKVYVYFCLWFKFNFLILKKPVASWSWWLGSVRSGFAKSSGAHALGSRFESRFGHVIVMEKLWIKSCYILLFNIRYYPMTLWFTQVVNNSLIPLSAPISGIQKSFPLSLHLSVFEYHSKEGHTSCRRGPKSWILTITVKTVLVLWAERKRL